MSTLLIEADLRKPTLAKAFGVGDEGGLSLFLSGHFSPLPKINKTQVPNLSLIAAGPVPPNPVALLNSERLTTFLHEVSATFKFVVIDAPPLLPFADARVLGSKADGVVLVVRAGVTAKNLVRRACSLLEKSGSNILGMVLNGTETDPAQAGYYHYYSKNGDSPKPAEPASISPSSGRGILLGG
jgi:capsular exopolysaccharide synthesis family protein